jgi:uncharacterized protein YidB (DUF937 family)
MARDQALEQVRLEPTLATSSLSSLAKRWGVSRSTARAWMKDVTPHVVPLMEPVAVAMAGVAADHGDGRL